jgi:hypothetical protein
MIGLQAIFSGTIATLLTRAFWAHPMPKAPTLTFRLGIAAVATIASFTGVARASVITPLETLIETSGNGGGYSGPLLNSQSIPIELDRGIKLRNAFLAIKVCLVDGDKKAGLISVAERLVNSLSKLPYSKFIEIIYNEYGLPSIDEKNNAIAGRFERYIKIEDGKYEDFKISIAEGFFVITGPSLSNSDLYSAVKLAFPHKLPYLKFTTSVSDSQYDELGRLAQSEQILQGLKIILPSDYGTAVNLINDDTKKRTHLTVNMVEYVQCLHSQVQKYAE